MARRGPFTSILAVLIGLGLLGAGLIMLRFGAAGTEPASGIGGQVMIGPMCPVVREGELCPDKPFAARLLVRPAGGGRVQDVRTDAQGHFRVALPPGVYRIEPQPEGIALAPEQQVTVQAGRWTAVSIRYDSGIR
jgi:hypothetical protein